METNPEFEIGGGVDGGNKPVATASEQLFAAAIIDRMPKEGAWDTTCPFCFESTKAGDVPHKSTCVVPIAKSVLSRKPDSASTGFDEHVIARAHNATLQSQDDTKRLDWLDKHLYQLMDDIQRKDQEYAWTGKNFVVNVRDTIDAAMRKETKQ